MCGKVLHRVVKCFTVLLRSEKCNASKVQLYLSCKDSAILTHTAISPHDLLAQV